MLHKHDPISVLDKGFVRLVDSMGNDLSIVRAARVSFDADKTVGGNPAKDSQLINYLWKNQHTTPFEAVTFTFEIKAPIFVLRQWMRHRTWSYNELSARYKNAKEEVYVPKPNLLGKQSLTNKQARDIGHDDSTTIDPVTVGMYQAAAESAFILYMELLKSGWPREIARGILPVATYSHMVATVNLLNLFKFLTLRLDQKAQYEIRVYAEALLGIIQDIVPDAVRAWKDRSDMRANSKSE